MERPRVGLADRIRSGEARGEGSCEIEREAVIEQGQRLQRGGGAGPAGRGRRDIGQVEVAEYVDHARARVLVVHGPAVGLRPGSIEREVGRDVVLREAVETEPGPAHRLEAELTGHGQEGVAEFLGAEAARRETPEQAAIAVDGGRLGPVRRALAVGTREQDLEVQRFQPPAVVQQAAREEVEQFGVRRRAAEEAEVARGVDDPGTEVVLPHAVGEDAGREWVALGRDPARERQAPFALGRVGWQRVPRQRARENL